MSVWGFGRGMLFCEKEGGKGWKKEISRIHLDFERRGC